MSTSGHTIDAEVLGYDPITETCIVKDTGGKEYTLIKEVHEISVWEGQSNVGEVVPGSCRSGSVLVRGELIGEYFLFDEYKYSVIPYEDGMKNLDHKQEIHPVDYILERV